MSNSYKVIDALQLDSTVLKIARDKHLDREIENKDLDALAQAHNTVQSIVTQYYPDEMVILQRPTKVPNPLELKQS